jgi:hypothetical protein
MPGQEMYLFLLMNLQYSRKFKIYAVMSIMYYRVLEKGLRTKSYVGQADIMELYRGEVDLLSACEC